MVALIDLAALHLLGLQVSQPLGPVAAYCSIFLLEYRQWPCSFHSYLHEGHRCYHRCLGLQVHWLGLLLDLGQQAELAS
jgi:hypothetical protein